MAQINPQDPLFVKRGIDPEVAMAQGFAMWTPEDYVEVINAAYSDIIDKQPGSVQWLRGKARESGTGVIITRHSPVDVRVGGVVHPLVPEIRPDHPVKSGMTKRHYHGPAVLPYEFLPSVVLSAHVRPDSGFVKSYRLKFKHLHGDLGPEELDEHVRIWHQPDLGENGELDNDQIAVVAHPVERAHWHTLEVYPENIMTEHINQGKKEAGKKTWAHKGVNNGNIHFHTPMAKYLFAPSEKVDQSWNDQPHRHDRMSEEELAWHLQMHHAAAPSLVEGEE